jgi:homoserine kinase
MKTVHLRLPATSANLGPGFDAMALALELSLDVDATPAQDFSISATGRNQEICGGLNGNLLIETYRSTLVETQKPVVPLDLRVHNEIPVGMGCGSSAAVRLAGVALASVFGGLNWDSATIVERAARLEGHPDNVAACWYGGLTVAAGESQLATASLPPPADWRAVLVLPDTPVATAKARAMLPERYSRQDVVTNVQNVALLTAAFALGRHDLMHLATRDCLHQPYRNELCPLLPALLPLAGAHGVISVTLSGAGPAVLLLIRESALNGTLDETIPQMVGSVCKVEVVTAGLSLLGAQLKAEG